MNSRTQIDRDQGRRMQKETDENLEKKQRQNKKKIITHTDINLPPQKDHTELNNVHRATSLSSGSQAQRKT